MSSSGQVDEQPAKNELELVCLLTQEQKQLKYEKMTRRMIKSSKGKLADDEKRTLSEEVQDLLQRWEKQCQEHASHRLYYCSASKNEETHLQSIRLDVGVLTCQQWLEKLRKLRTKFNIAPFTFTGDVNDAIFPLLNAVQIDRNLLAVFRKHYNVQIELPTVSRQTKRVRNKIRKEPTEKVKQVIFRRSYFQPTEKKYKPQKFNWQPPVGKGRYTKSERLKYRAKFAEQIRKTVEQFEQFCEEYEGLPTLTRRENPTAIFGLCPFAPVTLESPTRRSSEQVKKLPLKFPWNEVFETNTCIVKWRNSSVLFSIDC